MKYACNLPDLFASKLAELRQKQSQITAAYEYEKNFDEWWTALGKEVFQATLDQEGQPSHPKKNALPNSAQ